MASIFKESFNGFGRDILNGIRQKFADQISDAEFEERMVGIEKATAAMVEAGVDEETIIKMLQKYWDLRLSEANEFLDHVKDRD